MSEMDGIVTLHRIREQEGGMNRDTKIIALTANAGKGARQMYLRGIIGGISDSTSQLLHASDILEQSRTEMIGIISGLSDIAESNVTNTRETGEVITEMSEHFKEVQQSALNLKETADILEQNIRNFKMQARRGNEYLHDTDLTSHSENDNLYS